MSMDAFLSSDKKHPAPEIIFLRYEPSPSPLPVEKVRGIEDLPDAGSFSRTEGFYVVV